MTIEKLLELRDDAVAQLDVMMIYAGTRDMDQPPRPIEMVDDIRECLNFDYFSFCGYYFDLYELRACEHCIINAKNNLLQKGCNISFLIIPLTVYTWRDWIIAVQNIKHFIVKRVDEEIAKMEAAA